MSLDHLRILLLDDNPHDRPLTLRELQKQFPAGQASEPIDVAHLIAAVVESARPAEAGFDAHLVTPVHPDSAVKLLSDLLASRGPG